MGMAMFGHITQRFLYRAEQTKGDILSEILRYVPHHTIDLKLVLARNFMAEVAHGGRQSEIVQL